MTLEEEKEEKNKEEMQLEITKKRKRWEVIQQIAITVSGD